MFASEIIPAVLFLSFLMFVPETSRYHIALTQVYESRVP
ncbi:hypothetical protein NE573_23380 [Parabacteroides distasonis]|nr:hypothetical protein [Parabacteroides distasonis]MCQ5182985.1 hypothetical protein [Parabacteroides distasonis]